MKPEPTEGRTETPMHVFPVADLTLSGAGPQPGAVYGRTEAPVHVFPPAEVEFSIPCPTPGEPPVPKPGCGRFQDAADYLCGKVGGVGKKAHGKNITTYAELDREWFETQWSKQNGRCHWTGIPLIRDVTKTDDWRFVSIERLDQAKGHTPDNCVLACRFVNWGRNKYTGDFVQFLRDLRAALNEEFSDS